jgi:cell division protein FtsI/penicillin-binding protein 2
VQDDYDPGSTFKIVTAAAAIEERIVTPHQLIETSPGHITIGSRKPIRDTHNYGTMTFEDVIVKSSNVGAIKVGLQTGAEKLSRYVNRFGFGQVLAPDFVGQSRGIWNPARLDDSSLASISMGYQVSVTPLQMAAAVSSVANGGRLLEPRVIRAIVRDGQREAVQPKVLRQTISPATAETVRAMLEQVVERGTATVAKLPGYDIAGKTGTASKIVDRAYSKTDYNASFVGFAPSRHPAFTILVVIDTPRAGTYYGGSVAAPVFKRIAEGALQLAGIPPSNGPTPTIMHGDLGPVRRARATTVLPSLVPVGGPALMPDLRGLSAREAVRVMVDAGLSPRMSGTGFVARQTPAAGVPVEPGGWAAVELQRRLPDPDDQVTSQ